MLNPLLAVLLHVLWTAVFLAVAIYATAILDMLLGGAVAQGSPRSWGALGRPLRTSALLLLQSRTSTERPDVAGWTLAPALLGASAATALALVPFSARAAAAMDISSGIVYFGAAMALVMIAVYLEGWSPNSPFPLIGGYRFVAQALSYEMPLALVLIAAALPAQSLSVGAIVRSQAGTWNVIRQPLGLPIYLIASIGLAFWGPLSSPAGQDLAGGVRAELSGLALLLWHAAHIAVVVAASAMGAAVFLGGWLGPWLPGVVWMTLKTVALIVVILASGHMLARVRLEWFVLVAWVMLIPAALVDVFASGVLVLLGKSH